MARAKRHYIPGYVWHITQRCHKNFLHSSSRGVSDAKRKISGQMDHANKNTTC